MIQYFSVVYKQIFLTWLLLLDQKCPTSGCGSPSIRRPHKTPAYAVMEQNWTKERKKDTKCLTNNKYPF